MSQLRENRSFKVSVLIVSWNSWQDLRRCIDSINRTGFQDLEILVIDNASSDGTLKNLARYYPHVSYRRNEVNIGHTRAVNQGLRILDGKYILLLDADTELEKHVITILTDFMDSNPDISLVAPRTYNADGSLQKTARNFPTAINGVFGRQGEMTRLFPNNPFSKRYLMNGNHSDIRPYRVEQISSACMMFPSALVGECGVWDEKYFGYWVDTDWCWRLKKLNKKVYCVPAACIFHHEGNSRQKKKHPSRILMFHRGAFRLYRKHYTYGSLDPRVWFALVILTLRAVILITINAIRSERALHDAGASVHPREGCDVEK